MSTDTELINDTPSKTKKKLTIDLSTLIIVILVVITLGMLFAWKPWEETISANSRKITISGAASVEAVPDEYQFNPYYRLDSTEEATKLNNNIVAKLKELGVTDEQIKNNASSYGSREIYYMAPDSKKEVTTLNLTITVKDKELSQKVQDYLLTTDPQGSITPYATFSTEKRKELEDQVRTDAITDARTKAESTAEALGAEVGEVIEVSEGGSVGYDCGWGVCSQGLEAAVDSSEDKSLKIQPGVDEFTYSVSVVFALK